LVYVVLWRYTVHCIAQAPNAQVQSPRQIRDVVVEVTGTMPTYEYQCKTCGHHFEKMQRFSDNPLTECPKCSGEIRRVIHPAGVIFKGSGWYITDSRKSSSATVNADGAKKDGDAASAESKPAESKAADTKPAESKATEKTAAST